MSSAPLFTPVSQHHPLGGTPVGVDVGVKNLIAAAPVDGDVESAFTIEGNHVRTHHETLVRAIRALQGAKFDSTDGQIQLFAALWHQIRPQVYDAAVRVVRYAQEFAGPMLVLEDLPFCGASLWERRTGDDVGTWLLPALQQAIAVKARGAEIPVLYVDPKHTTQQCHVCGELGSVGHDVVECTTASCPVGTVSRDESAALSIAQRADLAEPPEVTDHADD
ncbi:MAG: zinc ribbon domain-containing protein [Halorhabdus sp.]